MLTSIQTGESESTCGICAEGSTGLPRFSMAFQPIIDVVRRSVFAYEALVRGPLGEPSGSVLGLLKTSAMRYQLDRGCRIAAIEMAARLGIARQGAKLSINFMPGSVYNPETCLRTTLKAAKAVGFPLDALIFEILEDERIGDIPHLNNIVAEYHKQGFRIALDDFGAGYSGLTLLSQVPADIVKLDAALVRSIERSPRAQAVVRHTVALCAELGVTLVGEAVETLAEYETLLACGVVLMQGYMFARPAFEALPPITWPA